jgi:hypothetical protein
MPRPCTVCQHPQRLEIDKALVAGDAIPAIIARYSTLSCTLGRMALQRHKDEHLPRVLVQAQEAEEREHALDVMTELRRCFARVNLVLDACHAWLLDPEDPTRYTLEPRADDVWIIYTERGPGGKPERKKARLSRLLARLEDAGVDVQGGEHRVADPRKLVLDAAAQLRETTALLAGLLERLHGFEEAQAFQDIVITILREETPDVHARVDAALQSRLLARGVSGRPTTGR